jgi:glycosyltransferase involved in cell wall biosynthesis
LFIPRGDVPTWSGVAEYFDDVAVIAQREGLVPRRHRIGKVQYVLIPRFPRPVDVLVFPIGAALTAFAFYVRGVRTWSASDPLRSGLVGLAIRSLPGVRLVAQVQGQLLQMPSDRFGRATRLVEGVSRFVVRRADAVRVVSREIADCALAAGVQPERIFVVRSRCDTRLFDPDRWKAAGDEVRADLPGDPVAPVLGFVGTLNASKGIDLLVEAANDLAERRPLRLAIAGDGPLRTKLDAASTHGALSIAFLGRIPADEVPGFLAAIDVLAVPSYDEGLPRVVLEAMAMGVPVVASSVGGIPEAVENGVTGILVPPGESASLAAALAKVFKDEKLASRLGEAGRRRVLEEFDARAGLREFAALHGSAEATRPLPE